MKNTLLLLTILCYSINLNSQDEKNEAMTAFKFNGDWNTRITLSEFSVLKHKGLARHDDDVAKGNFGMTIYDVHDLNPDPEPEQLNAINFLISNQKEVLAAVYAYIKTSVYPEYKTFLSPTDYPEAYPELYSPADLPKVIGVNEIIIHKLNKADHAYIVLGLNSCLDYEHGLYITMHKLRSLDFAQMGDFEDKEIIKDLGQNYDEYLEVYYKKQNQEHPNFYNPPPKYGKTKPWQDRANSIYPNLFLEKNDLEGLKTFLESHEAADEKHGYTYRYLGQAIYQNRPAFIDYLLSRKPTHLIAPFQTALQQLNLPVIKRIIELIPDINERRGQESYLYKVLLQFEKQFSDPTKQDTYKVIIAALFEKGMNPYLQEKWGRNALFCYKHFKGEAVKEAINQIIVDHCNKHGIISPKE